MIPLLIIITAGLLIGGGSLYVMSKNSEPAKNVTGIENQIDSSVTETTAVQADDEPSVSASINATVGVDADIQAVSNLMQRYKTAFENEDATTVKSLFSKATLDLFTQLGGGFSLPSGSKITIGSITRSGNNIRAEAVETRKNGAKETQTYIFISENGQWKIDMNASLESDIQKNDASQSDQNGYVDLVVTGIKVHPSRPIVNDENVEIAVTIKNIGTKSSEKGAPAIATILENTEYTPTQGGSLAPLGAGQSVTWTYRPYGQNKFFNRTDAAGKKTVSIELNILKEVAEKNYDNNVFTQSIEIFAQ